MLGHVRLGLLGVLAGRKLLSLSAPSETAERIRALCRRARRLFQFLFVFSPLMHVRLVSGDFFDDLVLTSVLDRNYPLNDYSFDAFLHVLFV